MKKQLNSHMFEETYKDLNVNLDELGCVMVDVNPIASMRTSQIPQENLYTSKKNRPWINGWVAGKTAHVTLLYGLLENAHNIERHIARVLYDWELQTVEIDHISYFDSPYNDEDSNYYCIVAHIKVTKELLEGHHRLEFLPHVNTFADYKPHLTICYIKKDEKLLRYWLDVLNNLYAGKQLQVRSELNLGYKPKK